MLLTDVLLRLRLITQGDLDQAILVGARTKTPTELVLVAAGKLSDGDLKDARSVLEDIQRRPVQGRAQLVARQLDNLKFQLS